jgi:hypothetical protein
VRRPRSKVNVPVIEGARTFPLLNADHFDAQPE